jgi:hypothetical protein
MECYPRPLKNPKAGGLRGRPSIARKPIAIKHLRRERSQAATKIPQSLSPDPRPPTPDFLSPMSNPLLKPNDPRFQKPEVRDAEGKNRFGEGPQQGAAPQQSADIYQAPAADEARPFEPRYEAQQEPRTWLLFLLGGLAWVAAAVGTVSLTGLLDLGWISPLVGLVPGGSAWFMAYEELKAIRVGAITSNARSQTLYAFWLGLTALLACVGIVAAMIYRKMHFLPDLW